MVKPVVLAILDGWGHSDSLKENAILLADTPNYDRFLREAPHSFIGTSGLDVGLPAGQMGNSEVGHMTIGAGRIIYQDLPRIDQAIKDGSLKENERLAKFIQKLRKSGGRCHLLGLASDGGVHAHIRHIIELARIVASEGIEVMIHAITDGRDTPPNSAEEFLNLIETELPGNPRIHIATLIGRYFAMDRDKRWERVELAYDAIVSGLGEHKSNPEAAIKDAYNQNKTDEFIMPAIIGQYKGMNDDDGLIMANFRADRAREILEALVDPEFSGFARKKTIEFASCLGMVSYSERLDRWIPALFQPQKIEKILPEIVAEAGLKQLRIAETEKYAHVTFFLSGGREKEFPGEERILIPSPKVATYDLKPEMSAGEVTKNLVKAIESGKFDLIVVNFANTDMVGHTGNLTAAIKAAEEVDKSLGQITKALDKVGGAMLVTADHGNAEEMHDAENDARHTQHTLNPVPCIIYGLDKAIKLKNGGSLADVAPTVLEMLGIPKPKEMTGNSLIIL